MVSDWLAGRSLLADLMTQPASCYRQTSDGTIIGHDDDHCEDRTTLMADQYLLATLGHYNAHWLASWRAAENNLAGDIRLAYHVSQPLLA